jgi:hypothetical protein
MADECAEDFAALEAAAADCAAEPGCDACQPALDLIEGFPEGDCAAFQTSVMIPLNAIALAGNSWCGLSRREKKIITDSCTPVVEDFLAAASTCATAVNDSSVDACTSCSSLIDEAAALEDTECAGLLEEEFADAAALAALVDSKCTLLPTCSADLAVYVGEVAECVAISKTDNNTWRRDGSFCSECEKALLNGIGRADHECAAAFPTPYGAVVGSSNATWAVCEVRTETLAKQASAQKKIVDTHSALLAIAAAANASDSAAAADAVVDLLYVYFPPATVDATIEAINEAVEMVVNDFGSGNSLSKLVEMTEPAPSAA